MPFGYDTSRPSGQGSMGGMGYTWGQRLGGLALRGVGSFLGGPLGGYVGGKIANGWDNRHNPNAPMGHMNVSQAPMPGPVGYQSQSFGLGGQNFGNGSMQGFGNNFGNFGGQPSFGSLGFGGMSQPFAPAPDSGNTNVFSPNYNGANTDFSGGGPSAGGSGAGAGNGGGVASGWGQNAAGRGYGTSGTTQGASYGAAGNNTWGSGSFLNGGHYNNL